MNKRNFEMSTQHLEQDVEHMVDAVWVSTVFLEGDENMSYVLGDWCGQCGVTFTLLKIHVSDSLH